MERKVGPPLLLERSSVNFSTEAGACVEDDSAGRLQCQTDSHHLHSLSSDTNLTSLVEHIAASVVLKLNGHLETCFHQHFSMFIEPFFIRTKVQSALL